MRSTVTVIWAVLLSLLIGSAQAQSSRVRLNIEAQPMRLALKDLGQQTGLSIVFREQNAAWAQMQAPPIQGELSAEEALERMLANTALQYRFVNPKTVVISGKGPETTASNFSGERIQLAQASDAGTESRSTAAAPAADSSAIKVEEIVVTASKRGAYSLQDIPYNISAVTADQLSKTGATTLDDVARLVPGVNVVGAQSNKQVIIRGLAATAGAPQVTVYLDETPLNGAAGNVRQGDLGLYDIQQVEVLRGPQGTLYGAGSQGGTIRYITNKPDLTKFEGSIGARAGVRSRGGDTRLEGNGMVNIPLVEDKVALRGVAYWREVDGFVDLPAIDKKGVDVEKTPGGRLQFLLKPAENTSILAMAAYQKTEMEDTSRAVVTSDSRPTAVREPFEDELKLFNLTVEQNIGVGTLTGTITKFKRDTFYVFDVSQFIFPNLGSVNQGNTTDTTTGEVRFASRFDGPLQVVTGVFYEDRDYEAYSNGLLVNPANGFPFADPPIPFFRVLDDGNTRNTAAFINGIWDINEKLSAEAGIRFYKMKRRGDSNLVQDIFGRPLGPSPTQRSKSTGNVPRFQLSYQATPDLLIYGTYSEGFREGGPNAPGLSGNYPLSYDPDVVKNYEFGWKTMLLDRQWLLNGAVYYMKWDDVQVAQFDTTGAFQFVVNAGAADLKGAELEGQLTPHAIPGFSANLALRVSNQKLTKDNPLAVGPPPNPFAGLDGDRIPFTNKFGANLGLQQRFRVSDFDMYVRGDASYVGKAYTTFNREDPLGRPINDYTLVDLRLGVERSDWDASIYARNVFNKRAFTNVTVEFIPGLPDRAFTTEPREFGVQFVRRF